MHEYMTGSVNERINDLIIERKTTQVKLAKAIGVSEATMSRYAKGTTAIPCGVLLKIARYFQVTTDFLLGATNIPNKTNYDIDRLGLTEEAAKRLIRHDLNILIQPGLELPFGIRRIAASHIPNRHQPEHVRLIGIGVRRIAERYRIDCAQSPSHDLLLKSDLRLSKGEQSCVHAYYFLHLPQYGKHHIAICTTICNADACIIEPFSSPTIIVYFVTGEVWNAIQQLVEADGIAALFGDSYGVGGIRFLPFELPDTAVYEGFIQSEMAAVQTVKVENLRIR